MPRWWAPAAMRAADRLSVRYRETIGLVAGLESTGSRSGASVEVGRLTMSTACFEAPTLPSKRGGKSGCHSFANIHIDLAASHHGTFFPVRGGSVSRENPAAFHDAARLPESQAQWSI